jgi:DnaJ-class molecular chaperone
MENKMDPYEIFEIERDADEATIKKAYKKSVLKYHPDRNQDLNEEETKQNENKIREINAAYEILSDEEKKSKYDKFGVIDEDDNGMQGADMADILRKMGINIPGMGGQQQQQEIGTQNETITITLDELYNGTAKQFSTMVNNMCEECDGHGTNDKKNCDCNNCNGSGVEIKLVRANPMIPMMQQVQRPCEKCNGTGHIIKNDNKCKKCLGEGLVKKKVEKNIKITKKFDYGTKMRLKKMGNYDKNHKKNCDIIISFDINFSGNTEFKLINGQGYDLILEKNINIKDAFTGYNMHYKHLDGSNYCIKFDEIIEDGDVKVVMDHGLPNSTDESKLLIKFNIIYPKHVLTNDKYEKFAAEKEIINSDIESEENVTAIDIQVYKENMEREQRKQQQSHGMHGMHGQGPDGQECIIS